MRTLRPVPAAAPVLALLLLAGCGNNEQAFYQGYVEGEYVYIASSEAGRLDALTVRRGQQVGADTPLYALEATREAAARDQASAELAAASAQLEDIATGKRPPEVDVSLAQLAQAEAASRRSAAQLQRDSAQFRIGGIARSQLDDSREQAQSDAARVRELKAQLEVTRLPGRDEQRRAQAAQVEAARAALTQAEWTLAQKRLAAPAAGQVFDTMYRVGEWVPAGSPVVSLLPPGNIKVRFFVPETVVGSLKVGQQATLRCDGCGDPIPVRIDYVSDQAEYTPPVIYSRESRSKLVYMVEARPAPEAAARLHPGQPVEATLQ
ncbi:HlyD family secretion protein [Achromobacter deleyi]|uniref:HlyD family secretion protein n=1 Tax=Achromobacter deleyi TaxID=1353891 RepID=UPI0014931505|nr:HlyD family efflux transporter periplasmic adaptor subunit [Achromobacter deleyi]QVQ27907.1 HlyD family efflux transporter periplasmic adaptor subunit [Achromobacter deleyi]UIP23517.1 HlyD family efflux transporter periplasmic adaptor subunit [Achromobacter deleyi]